MDICIGWPIGHECKKEASAGPFCKSHGELYYDAARYGKVNKNGCLCLVGIGVFCGRTYEFNLKKGACRAHIQRKTLNGEFGLSPIQKRITRSVLSAAQESSLIVNKGVPGEAKTEKEDDWDVVDRILTESPEDVILLFIAQYGSDRLLDLASEVTAKQVTANQAEITEIAVVSTPVKKKRTKVVVEIKIPDCGIMNENIPAIRAITEGKSMLIISSRIDNHVMAKVKSVTGVKVLDTAECDCSNMNSYGERIKNKRYDMVVVSENFLSHRTTQIITPACKSAGVPLIYSGKGRLIGIVSALAERFLSTISSS